MGLGALDSSYLARTQARDERKMKAEERKSTSGSLLEVEEQEDFNDDHSDEEGDEEPA